MSMNIDALVNKEDGCGPTRSLLQQRGSYSKIRVRWSPRVVDNEKVDVSCGDLRRMSTYFVHATHRHWASEGGDGTGERHRIAKETVQNIR